MSFHSVTIKSWELLDVRPGEATRIGFSAAFIFFLLAANNVIKVVRDSLFLSRFPITRLPYMYLLAVLVAALVIGVYSRYAATLAFSRVILGSLVFVISSAVLFWLLVTFYGAAWVLYAYYMWSAIVGLTLVAQFWTLANDLFTPREGKRLFGIIAAGGTLGGMTGGIVANWGVRLLFGTNQLLWLVVALLTAACGVAFWALRKQEGVVALRLAQGVPTKETAAQDIKGVLETVISSRYLQTIGGLIFVSVVVSTLIDYQFKAFAKEAYGSADALAGFFGAYYAWLSVLTLSAQLWLTGKVLTGLGLAPSLLLLPATLMVGSMGLLAWPGLFVATANRMAEASLRISVSQSGTQILYLPIPDSIKKKVKVFMDVTIERLGDGMAALIILFVSFALGGGGVTLLSYFSIGLIVIWIAMILNAHGGYIDTLRRSLAFRELSLETARIDYADKETVDAVLKTLEEKEERSVLFGLELIERLAPTDVVARLPHGLLRHPSAEIRARAVRLFARRPDSAMLVEISQMLEDENERVQAEAISAATAIFEGNAVPVVRPYLESSNPEIKRRVLECLLRHGDPVMQDVALTGLRAMATDSTERSRVEAAHLAGEVYDPALAVHLSAMIKEEHSHQVIHAAMAAASKRKYPTVVKDIMFRLGNPDMKVRAREALIQYGENAVETLSEALFDLSISREVRINIPRTLSKIPSQSAMDALISGLQLEDRSIRYKVILGLEEMARRFSTLKVDSKAIESAIVSDALLYFRRFVIFFVLFGHQEERSRDGASLLSHALTDSMERVRERVMWLLSLVYPSKDIRRAWIGLSSTDLTKRAYAIEFLDNLLTGNLKQYVFPLFSDAPQDERFKAFRNFVATDISDVEVALRRLLDQGDVWLTAAAVWEIGLRGLTGFREEILSLINSENLLLREAAGAVIRQV